MNQMIGRQSVYFENPVSIISAGSVVGQKEGEGPLGKAFDLVVDDPMMCCNSWEEA